MSPLSPGNGSGRPNLCWANDIGLHGSKRRGAALQAGSVSASFAGSIARRAGTGALEKETMLRIKPMVAVLIALSLPLSAARGQELGGGASGTHGNSSFSPQRLEQLVGRYGHGGEVSDGMRDSSKATGLATVAPRDSVTDRGRSSAAMPKGFAELRQLPATMGWEPDGGSAETMDAWALLREGEFWPARSDVEIAARFGTGMARPGNGVWPARAERYVEPIRNAAIRNGVDPLLALAVAWQESDFDPNARSHAGALGIMQVLPDTAVDMAALDGERLSSDESARRLLLPEENIRIGVRYLAHLQRRYADVRDEHRRRNTVLAAYNAGVQQVARVFGCPVGACAQAINEISGNRFEQALRQLPEETRGYLVKVTAAHDRLRKESGDEPR
jgi:hypothetical protein